MMSFRYLSRNRWRFLAGLLVIVLLLPTAVAGIQSSGENTRGTVQSQQNVTFASYQGGAIGYGGAGVFAIDTDTKQIIWSHTKGGSYYDVDPLDADRLLFVYTNSSTGTKQATIYDWRDDRRLETFRVPRDTHDVDHIRDDRFIIADKYDHRIYIENITTGDLVWEYKYDNHFDRDTDGEQGDFTHLNDIDAVGNASYFLASPRNFDRVHLINRSTKETVWTLGSEDDYDTLYEQHNPVLLSRAPPTVLVADSENNRVVEYELRNESWVQTWEYTGGAGRQLSWPRDADRLPNGNTLISDTATGRTIEVTPNKSIVWEFQLGRSAYEAERLPYGDEPAGPPMSELNNDPSKYPEANNRYGDVLGSLVDKLTDWIEFLFQKVGIWILPAWVGRGEFVTLSLAVGFASVWAGTEAFIRLPETRLRRKFAGRICRLEPAISILTAAAGLLAIPSLVDIVELALVERVLLEQRRGLRAKFVVSLALTALTYTYYTLKSDLPLTDKQYRTGAGLLTVASGLTGGLLFLQQVLVSITSTFTVLFTAINAMLGVGLLRLWEDQFEANQPFRLIMTLGRLSAMGSGILLSLLSFSLGETYLQFPTNIEGILFYLLLGTAVIASGLRGAHWNHRIWAMIRDSPVVSVLRIVAFLWIAILGILIISNTGDHLASFAITVLLSMLVIWPPRQLLK